MKLLESYAGICGVDITKSSPPNIYESFYPSPPKYVTLQNSSGFESKNYDFWQDVLDYLENDFKKRDIHVLQLGDDKSSSLRGVVRLCGQTNMHQTNYLIRRAMLHMGNDSCLNYLCAYSDTPFICLYGPTSIPNHSPYHLPSKYHLFDSHRYGNKPSLSMSENPKTINLISPEKVAAKVLELVNAQDSQTWSFLSSKETVYTGEYYLGTMFEYIPDHIIPDGFVSNGNVIIRGDLTYDENNILNALSRHKCLLAIKEGVNINPYKKVATNISSISCEVSSKTSKAYIKELVQLGARVILYSTDAKNISLIRNNFYSDYLVELSEKETKKSISNSIEKHHKDVEIEKCLFRTNKLVLSKGSAFASVEHAKRGVRLQALNQVIDKASFYEECDKFRLIYSC